MRILLVLLGISLIATGCATTPTQQGALLGGGTGAGIGAIIGHQKGKTAEGALIGGAAGALAGGLIGDAAAQKFCPNCGSSFTQDKQFCPKCGAELKWKQK